MPNTAPAGTQRLLPKLTGVFARFDAWAQYYLTQRPVLGGQIIPVPLGTVLFTSSTSFEGQRICLFSHFQAQGHLLSSTLRYIQALHAAGLQIVCISTSPLSPSAVQTLRPHCHTLIVRDNTGLDFASWKCATQHFPSILKADALLLANDSVFLVDDMRHVFMTMDAVDCDFWGMTASHERRLHLQSYFMQFNKSALKHPVFLKFWGNIGICVHKHLIIRRWESALTLRLLAAGLRGAAFIPPHWLPDEGKANPTLAHGSLLCQACAMPLLKKAYTATAAGRQAIRMWRLQKRAPLPRIDVLLPTYNGAPYLNAQMESITAQQAVIPSIYLRDDASTDTTLSIARTFAATLADRDTKGLLPAVHISHGPRGGIVANMQQLVVHSQNTLHDYFALADQDDIWYPHKLHTQYTVIRKLEAQYGTATPILVYSDARGIDARGEKCFTSFLRQMGLPPRWGKDIREALVLSNALGCSCMGNAALRKLATPLPHKENIFMHDWWLLLVASCFGIAQCIDIPLLDYRQHAHNVLGVPNKKGFIKRWENMRANTARTQAQAATFLYNYGAQMNAVQREYVSAWASMPQNSRLRRLYLCVRYGFAKPGLRFLLT